MDDLSFLYVVIGIKCDRALLTNFDGQRYDDANFVYTGNGEGERAGGWLVVLSHHRHLLHVFFRLMFFFHLFSRTFFLFLCKNEIMALLDVTSIFMVVVFTHDVTFNLSCEW